MRTAEDYFQIYNNSWDKEAAIGKIASAFLQETAFEIKRIPAIAPNIPTEKVRDVLKRQNEKWRAFAELLKIVCPEGYEFLLQRRAPELFSIFKNGAFQ